PYSNVYSFSSTVPSSSASFSLSLHDALPILVVRVFVSSWWLGRGLYHKDTQTRRIKSTGNLIHCEDDLLVFGAAGRMRFPVDLIDRKSTRLNSSHVSISYAVFCLKKKNHV